MSEKRKEYDREFRDGAAGIVEETGKPIAQVARDLEVTNRPSVGEPDPRVQAADHRGARRDVSGTSRLWTTVSCWVHKATIPAPSSGCATATRSVRRDRRPAVVVLQPSRPIGSEG